MDLGDFGDKIGQVLGTAVNTGEGKVTSALDDLLHGSPPWASSQPSAGPAVPPAAGAPGLLPANKNIMPWIFGGVVLIVIVLLLRK